MKTVLLILLFAFSAAAQTVIVDKTDSDFVNGNLEAQPRIRVSKSASMALTGSWQRVDFNGTSTANVNTFSGTPKMVEWDATNKLFKFNSAIDRNYDYSFYATFSGGLRPAFVLYRFVIPRPANEGGNYYFPFPDESEPYIDFALLESIDISRRSDSAVIYASSIMRQYGLGVEMKSKTILTLYPSVTHMTFIIYGR